MRLSETRFFSIRESAEPDRPVKPGVCGRTQSIGHTFGMRDLMSVHIPGIGEKHSPFTRKPLYNRRHVFGHKLLGISSSLFGILKESRRYLTVPADAVAEER